MITIEPVIFVVFKSTIEFRGAEFIFWISDLSQPDIIFNLPFTLPLYGGHIAILPVLMGVSIFLTQRMSMATMDPAQKPMMYIMNVFFVLLCVSLCCGEVRCVALSCVFCVVCVACVVCVVWMRCAYVVLCVVCCAFSVMCCARPCCA